MAVRSFALADRTGWLRTIIAAAALAVAALLAAIAGGLQFEKFTSLPIFGRRRVGGVRSVHTHAICLDARTSRG